jgi:hypothetical protein
LGEFNISICIFGLLYLIYSFLFRNKITVFNKREGMVVLNKDKYLKLQFWFSLVNSIVMIIIGIKATMLNLVTSNILLLPVLFHLINYLLSLVARGKGYSQYN